MIERILGTPNEARELSDVDVWIELTLADLAVYEEPDLLEGDIARFSQDTMYDEVKRRWGSDALERVATVITGGKYSEADELRWLREQPASFMRLVTGEFLPDDWFAELFD